jgi:small subunit ribosomal protein S20
MANTKSAKKRARQTPKRTTRNTQVKGSVKTALRAAREAITGNSADLKTKLSKAMSVVSKAGNKGILHKKTVARKISRLMKQAASTTSKRS